MSRPVALTHTRTHKISTGSLGCFTQRLGEQADEGGSLCKDAAQGNTQSLGLGLLRREVLLAQPPGIRGFLMAAQGSQRPCVSTRGQATWWHVRKVGANLSHVSWLTSSSSTVSRLTCINFNLLRSLVISLSTATLYGRPGHHEFEFILGSAQ